MGCVPNKKVSSQSNTKNSRVSVPEASTSNAPLPQSNLDNIYDGSNNSDQPPNFLTASRIAGDLEHQTKQNTYLNSLPMS